MKTSSRCQAQVVKIHVVRFRVVRVHVVRDHAVRLMEADDTKIRVANSCSR